MNQTEREYREALDSLRFSDAAKDRMIKHLAEQKEGQPVKRRNARPLRTGLIAAAVCAALLGTAGAATLAARQARITYLDRAQFDQEYNDYLEEHGRSSSQYSDNHYIGSDFTVTDAVKQETWWQGPLEIGELVEETVGTEEDGWAAKRVFECQGGGISYGLGRETKYLETRYKVNAVSDVSGMFDRWDVSWLEAHYTTNPCGTFARTITYKDDLRFIAVGGEYRGQDDARFNMSWSWDASYIHGDEFRVAGGREYEELYTTPDGVVLAIEMDTSKTGKSVFWVTLGSGHNSFNMFGTQLALDDLHDILDSLNLSSLLEYAPAQ